MVDVFPRECSGRGGRDAEGFFGALGVHVPIEIDDDGAVAQHRFVAVFPHGRICHYFGRCIAYFAHLHVCVGDFVSYDIDFGAYGIMGVAGGLDGVVSRGDVAEKIEAVDVFCLGGVCVHDFALCVNQFDLCALDCGVPVIAEFQIAAVARCSVVVESSGHHAEVYTRLVEVLIDGFAEMPCFHPAEVLVHQTVSLGDIIME